MKRILLSVAMLALLATPAVAQSKVKINYDVMILGVSKINDVEGEYTSLSATAGNDKFALTLTPFVLLWGDYTPVKYSANVEAAIRAFEAPVYFGMGKMIGPNGTNAYGLVTWHGPEAIPLSARIGASKNYFTASLGFRITP